MTSSTPPARDRLLDELRAQPATRAKLARRTGLNPAYAGEVLLGLQAAGLARRWKRPGTQGYIWVAELPSPPPGLSASLWADLHAAASGDHDAAERWFAHVDAALSEGICPICVKTLADCPHTWNGRIATMWPVMLS